MCGARGGGKEGGRQREGVGGACPFPPPPFPDLTPALLAAPVFQVGPATYLSYVDHLARGSWQLGPRHAEQVGGCAIAYCVYLGPNSRPCLPGLGWAGLMRGAERAGWHVGSQREGARCAVQVARIWFTTSYPPPLTPRIPPHTHAGARARAHAHTHTHTHAHTHARTHTHTYTHTYTHAHTRARTHSHTCARCLADHQLCPCLGEVGFRAWRCQSPEQQQLPGRGRALCSSIH